MKLRSRDINIFSMSALDLFASAMGAFMLLAVMALPFFPNTGDSKERVADVQKKLEQADKELKNTKDKLSDAEKEKADLSKELARIKIPDLDLVICLDISGSMGDQIEGLKSEITDLAIVLDRLAPSVGIGIVAFGDRVYVKPIHNQRIVKTSSMRELTEFVNRLKPNMDDPNADHNNDIPEALDMALTEAIAMNWRAESERKYIVVITDAPAYPEKEASALERSRKFSFQKNRYISTVMVGSRRAESFLQQLAESGQGEFVDAVGGQSMLTSLLLAIIKT